MKKRKINIHEARNRPMVVGIGLPKTGTTSLRSALGILGYDIGNVKELDNPYKDAFVGDSLLLPTTRYREIDIMYPNAMFILTLRKTPEIWYNSVDRWANLPNKKDHAGLRKQRKSMYGYEMPEKDPFIFYYKNHCEEVMDHFEYKYGAKAKEKLLIVCWETGDGWEEVCEFLTRPVPDRPFPMKNRNKKR